MRFSRVSRPYEVRLHSLRRDAARSLAYRSGHVVPAATGKGLEPFMPPTLSQYADAYRQHQLNAAT